MKRYYWYSLSVPTLGHEECNEAAWVLESRHTTMGDRVEEFEAQFAQHVGARYAVMVNSGSSADLLMAFAVRIALGDHRLRPTVLIPAVTWPTHVWSWHVAGFPVRFVDVEGVNTTTAIINAARNSQYDMVSVPHLMGIPADIAGLDCRVTEDCCEALGADVGRKGEMATWSFFFSHHITTMEGGMITTDQAEVASLLRSLRSHGWARHEGRDPYEFVTMGFNVRPTEISAAIGLVQLSRLAQFNKLRQENHRIFSERLAGCPGIELVAAPEGSNPFGLPFFADDRDGLAGFLEDQGVETRPILGGNLTRQPAFAAWAGGLFPGADRVHDHGLYVGLHPLADCGVEDVADLIARYLG